MSPSKPSRATLATLLGRVDATNWPVRVKMDVKSAIRTVGRWLDLDLDMIELDVAALRRRLEAISPEMVGVSKGRLNNIRSLVGKGLALAIDTLPSRSKEPILPEWAKILAPLPENRRWHLTPLARFLGGRGILPSNVGTSDLEAYHAALISNRLRSNPEGTWSSICWSWNACVREFEAWPQIKIERISRREIYILDWSDFNPSYRVDCEAYLDRIAKPKLSEDSGPPRQSRPATVETRRYQLRLLGSALALSGHDASTITKIADLLTKDAYKKIIDFFLNRHNNVTSPQIAQLAGFMRDLGKYWVQVEPSRLEELRNMAIKLSIKRKGMTRKNRKRLSVFDDPEMVARFLALPEQIRRDVEKSKASLLSRAVMASIAAAIAIEQMAPIRRKNLASLSFSENLVQRGNRLFLVFNEDETKNEIDIEFELPEATVDILAWFVREWRPILLSQTNDALFPGENGKAKHPNTLSKQVTDVMKRYLGIDFNLHLFRHAAGKIFLDAKPGNYEIMKRVLGHKSLNTTTTIYSGAETRSAGQLYAQVINERRLDIEAELKTKRGKKTAQAIKTVKQTPPTKTPSNSQMNWTKKHGAKS